MSHDDFRLLIFEVLEHHLDEMEDANTSEDIDYHVTRCRWAMEYLKRHTIATPVESMPKDWGSNNDRLDHS